MVHVRVCSVTVLFVFPLSPFCIPHRLSNDDSKEEVRKHEALREIMVITVCTNTPDSRTRSVSTP